MTKPFDHAELEARCRAFLRRKAGTSKMQITLGGVVFDPVAGQLQVRGHSVSLRNRELRLLELLINAPGQVFSKQKLAERLFSYSEDTSENPIEVYIGRVRKHLMQSDLKTPPCAGWAIGWIMAHTAATSGSPRNRLVLRLIGGSVLLALLLFVVVHNYAAQVAQQGQDNILPASVTSVLDAAAAVIQK